MSQDLLTTVPAGPVSAGHGAGAALTAAAGRRRAVRVACTALVWVVCLPAVLISAFWVLAMSEWSGRWAWVGVLIWVTGVITVSLVAGSRWARLMTRCGARFSTRADLVLLGLTAPWAVLWRVINVVSRKVPLGRVSLLVGGPVLLGSVAIRSARDDVALTVFALLVLHMTLVAPPLVRRLGGPSWPA